MFTYKKVARFITAGDLEDLIDLFSSIYSTGKVDADRKNVVEIGAEDVDRFELLKRLSEDIQKLLSESSGLDDLILKKIWLVETTAGDSDMSVLPYVPHFDKQRLLKGLVYLSDVDEACGPIHLTKDGGLNVEAIRRTLPKNHKEKKLNHINPGSLSMPIEPICGLSGDIILFDTNTPHHAGKVSEGCARRVVRFDFTHASFEKRSLLSRARSRITAEQ